MNELPENKPQNEIDIVALFEYFKNGIKSIFKGIAQIFSWIFSQILNLLYLIYKNWVLVFGLMLIFGALGNFKSHFLSPKYKYQMIVEPQLNSAYDLYNNIANLSQNAKDLDTVKGLSGLEKLEIQPITRLSDEMKMYYDVPKNTNITGSPDMYGGEKDTVFYRSMEFKDFQKELNAREYPLHEISIKANQAIDKNKIKELILQPFSNEFWKSSNENRINRLQTKEKVYQGFITRIDSLLLAYAKNPNLTQNSELRISGSGASNNVEYDLLNQVKGYSNDLEFIRFELNNSQDVVKIISDIKRVEDDSNRSYFNLWTGLILGFILSMLILFALYMLKYFKNYQPK